MGRRAPGGPLLDAGPAGGARRAAGCGALPQGCHAQFVRVAQLAAAGGGGGLRHLRAA